MSVSIAKHAYNKARINVVNFRAELPHMSSRSQMIVFDI